MWATSNVPFWWPGIAVAPVESIPSQVLSHSYVGWRAGNQEFFNIDAVTGCTHVLSAWRLPGAR
jgi:hypothetical protein